MLTLLLACDPSLGWTVASTCEGQVALAVETGDCGSRSGTPTQSTSDGELTIENIEPGLYCLSTLAYVSSDTRSTSTNGFDCRLLDVDSQTRNLPMERSSLVATLTCSEPPVPSAALDTLLEEVAGCSPACDVERCTCSASCVEQGTGECPAPVRGRQLAISDNFVCALAVDSRGLSCWGTGLAPGTHLGAALGEAPGVARYFDVDTLRVDPPTEEDDRRIFTMAADEDRLCFNLRKSIECVDVQTHSLASEVVDATAPTRIAVSSNVFCVGEANPNCVASGDDMPARFLDSAFRGGNEVTGTSGEICSIVGGQVVCATPTRLPPRRCTDRSCPSGLICVEQERGESVCQTPPIDLPVTIALDSGWGRNCVVTSMRDVRCWESGELSPRTVQREAEGELKALDVSVGEDHICVLRNEGGVECGRLSLSGDEYRFASAELLDVENVGDFVAGPDGVSCVIRLDDSAVVCSQLADFVVDGTPSPLLGIGNTSTLDPNPPVCP